MTTMQDKQKDRKIKRQKASRDAQKSNAALARALNECEEKRRARVAKGLGILFHCIIFYYLCLYIFFLYIIFFIPQ